MNRVVATLSGVFFSWCAGAAMPLAVEFESGEALRWQPDMGQVTEEIPANPSAARLAERSARTRLATDVQRTGGLEISFWFLPELDPPYARIGITLTNPTDKPIGIRRIRFSDPLEVVEGYTLSGNTDGAVLVNDKLGMFTAVEHPMAKIKITQTGTPAWTPSDIAAGSMTLPLTPKPGATITARFDYTKGNHRADIKAVQWRSVTGAVIAEDRHPGFTGHASKANTYTLTLPTPLPPDIASGITILFGLEKPGDTNSHGTITLTGLDLPANKQLLDMHLDLNHAIAPGETWSFSRVQGFFTEGQLRRAFQAYLERERAHPYRLLPHYNSWYDLCINRNDAPWQRRMNEQECLAAMTAFRTELGSRGVHIDSYLWDDGWDNWDSLWDFHPGFPRGFTPLAEEARRQNASIGAWLSPCGGYGGSQAARVRYSKSQGLETPGGLLSLSQPKYYAAFRDRCLHMITAYGMNLFKFDRLGSGHDANGADTRHAPDLQAIFRLIGEMRAQKPDVFINATVGTWASPFWVLFADSIWRGGNDWEGLGPGPQRERWITYRDNKIHDRFAKPCPLFPLNSIMTHGIIVADRGPPACMDRAPTPESTRSFANEVWMSVACGTNLQEYYITPRLMHKEWWDILAQAIRWMKANETTLRDAHWIGGDPADGSTYSIYGYASLGAEKGIAILRNPSEKPQSITIDSSAWFELPAGATISDNPAIIYTSTPENILERGILSLAPFGVMLLEFEREKQ